jgi:hypothetical protein
MAVLYGCEISRPTGFRSPDRPAHSESLYGLSYPDTEEELLNHILQLEQRVFVVTVNDLRRLAFQIAALNHFFRRFNKDKEIAVKKMYYGYMRRHD